MSEIHYTRPGLRAFGPGSNGAEARREHRKGTTRARAGGGQTLAMCGMQDR